MNDPASRTRTPRTQFFLAAAVGGSLAIVVFLWFVLGGRFDPLRGETLSNFYEAQARSWLHGRWDAGPNDFLFERFNVDGRFYTYFGPAPALLRIPVVLLTDSLDARIARISMTVAFAVLLASAAWLSWHARRLVRGEGPLTRAGLVAAGGFVFLSGCATTALFLSAKAWVYHEAILWAVALSVASYAFLVAYIAAPRRALLIGASAMAALAYLSRGSVGIGPVVALGIVFGARVLVRIRDKLRPRAGEPWILRVLGLGPAEQNRAWWPVLIAVAVPMILYSYVNYVKFGTLLGTPPYELQDELLSRPSRQAALAANDGSLFGLHFAPTILLAYFRPDAIALDRFFPWVTFPGPPKIIGNPTFEAANFSASVTITSLVFTVLVVLGIWGSIRSKRGAAFRIPMIGAAIGCVGMLIIAFLDERYLGDIVPLLVVGGAVGLWWLAEVLARHGRAVRAVVVTAMIVIAAWSVWATASLTLLEQREFSPLVTASTRANLLALQLDVHDIVPGGIPSGVLRGGDQLPEPAKTGNLYVVGDCDALYWSNGRMWHAVEQTPKTGQFRLDLDLAAVPAETREPLLSATDDRGTSILWMTRFAGNEAQFEYEWTGADLTLIEGVTPDTEIIGPREGGRIKLPAESPLHLAARMDPAGYVGVRINGVQHLSTFAPVADAPVEVGSQSASTNGTPSFSGTIDVHRPETPLCDRVTGRKRGD